MSGFPIALGLVLHRDSSCAEPMATIGEDALYRIIEPFAGG